MVLMLLYAKCSNVGHGSLGDWLGAGGVGQAGVLVGVVGVVGVVGPLAIGQGFFGAFISTSYARMPAMLSRASRFHPRPSLCGPNFLSPARFLCPSPLSSRDRWQAALRWVCRQAARDDLFP